MINIGDKVITPDTRYGTVIDTFGSACTVEFANSERDVFTRNECKEAEHSHPGVLCSPDWCGGAQSNWIFAESVRRLIR